MLAGLTRHAATPGLCKGVRAFLCAAVLMLGAPAARAQPVGLALPDTTPRIAEVRLDGPHVLPEATLRAALRTRPNRRFLGLPGATWWLWLYRTGQRAGLGRVGEALQALGEAPAVVDLATVTADADRLVLLLQQEGYRRARVEARLDTLPARRVRVRFLMVPGAPAQWRHVLYAVEAGEAGAFAADSLVRGSLLQPAGRLRVDTLRGFQGIAVRPGAARYSEALLVEERRRLVAALHDAGHAAASRDSVRALVYPVTGPDGDAFDLVLRVRPGPRFRFGGFTARVTGPEPGVAPRAFADGRPPYERIVLQRGERQLDPHLVLRRVSATPGALFREATLLATRRRLDATGAFTFVDVAPAWNDTFRVGGQRILPLRLDLRTRARHSVRAETFAQQRGGFTNLESAALGTGLAFTYEDANLLGQGEAFRVRAAGQVSTDPNEALFSSREAELTASLTAPYAIRPLTALERLAALGARTQGAVSVLTARRQELRLIIHSRVAARVSVELQHTPTLRSVVDGFSLALSNPDTLQGFYSRFLNDATGVPPGPERERLLEDYTRPQVSASVRYALQFLTAHPLRRDSGYAIDLALGGGGLLETLLGQLVKAPDSLAGTLPAPGGGRLFYRPYVRFTADVRRYAPLAPRLTGALRGAVGLAYALGPSGLVPFDQRFFSGGGTSVRGWGLRELGPGGARAQRGQVVNVSGADVWIETSAEARFTFAHALLGADWMGAAFADAGNVWYGPRNPGLIANVDRARDGKFRAPDFVAQLAVGTGAGIRLAWPYFVIRLDAAVRALDPAQRRLYPDGLRPTLHFGLGHAF